VPDYEIISPKRKRKQQYVAFGLVYAILSFLFLINGEALFEFWSPAWTYSTLFYMVGVAIFLASAERLPDEMRKPAIQSIYGFLIATPLFMVGFIALEKAGILVVSRALPVYLIIPTLIFEFGIVGASEEIIFRVAIFRALYRIRWYLAYVGSSVLFGFFHWAAYGGNFDSMMFAMVMGLLFCALVDRFNLGVGVALHGVWNAGLMGAFLFD